MNVKVYKPSTHQYLSHWWLLLALLFVLSNLQAQTLPGLRVQGSDLYTNQGEEVVLRGVNRMVFYQDRDGTQTFPEIAQTGANVVRIFWFTSGTPAELDAVLTEARNNNLIPVVACWEATGDWSQMQSIINYWSRSDIAAVFQEHEEYAILNIANEGGDYSVSDSQYRSVYSQAIQDIRNAGIHVPLMIDAAGWGRAESYFLDNGSYLLGQDPDSNLIFSWHPWDTNQPQTRYSDAISSAQSQGLCMVIGEFAEESVGCGCCIDYRYIMDITQQTGTGWMAWSWGPGNSDCAAMDMTEDGNYNTLHGWGLETAINDPNSIQNTSVIPPSLGGQPATLSINTTSLPDGIINEPYSESITASGGTTPYTWSIESGSLPAGLSLSGNTISGTPASTGSFSFTVKVTDNNSNTDTKALSIDVLDDPQQPYNGAPFTLPGLVEAEDYDTGGEGIAYSDSDASNNGGAYRTDGVDIESSTENNYNVGWMESGEWIEYTVDVPSGGAYTIDLRVASDVGNGSVNVSFSNGGQTPDLSINDTGGWQAWTTISASGINLTAGEQVMRVNIVSSGFNLNFIDVIAETTDDQAPSVPTGLAASNETQSSVDLSWNTATDNVGVTGYRVYQDGAQVADVSGTSTTLSGLSASTTYSFTVSAYDAAGNESAQSNTVNATTEDDPEYVNILSNPEFDNGTNGWIYNGSNGSLSVVQGENLSGTNAGKVTINSAASNEWEIELRQEFALEAGKTYQVSFIAKADANRSMKIISQLNQSPWTVYWEEVVNLTTTPQTYGPYEFSSPGDISVHKFSFMMGLDDADVYVDKVIFTDGTIDGGGDNQAPSVPTNIAASNETSSSVDLSWNASTDNVGVSGYRIYEGGAQVADVSGTSTTISGLSSGTTYSYTVSAYDAASNESAQSSAINATTQSSSGTGYRYLRITATDGNNIKFHEIDWYVNSNDYPQPHLTSSNSNGMVASGDAGSQSYIAYDGDNANHIWIGTNVPYQITLDLGSSNAIAPTSIDIRKYIWGNLAGFRCEGSNDGSSWTLLLEQTGLSNSGTELLSFNINSGNRSGNNIDGQRTLEANEPLIIYPNPSERSFNISFINDYQGLVDFSIVNLDGKLIEKFEMYKGERVFDKSITLDPQMKSGIYMMKIHFGSQQFIKRFVIE